jgi:hypothetical protein
MKKVLLLAVALALLVGCSGGSGPIGEPALTATPVEEASAVVSDSEPQLIPQPEVIAEPEVISAPEPVPEPESELTEAEYFTLTLNEFRGGRQLCGSTEYGPVDPVA